MPIYAFTSRALYLPRGRGHNAPLVWALALLLSIMLHAKIVSHFVSNCGGHESNSITVVHVHTS